jgi:iron complex outermembrane recepter protein
MNTASLTEAALAESKRSTLMAEGKASLETKCVRIRHKKLALRSGASLAVLSLAAGLAHAQQAGSSVQLPTVSVTAPANTGGYAAQPEYHTNNADLGPLGSQPILNTPTSVTVVPEDLITNQQAKGVNDILRYLPSVEVRDQQGFEVSRPQSRGFQGSIVQNTRLDGLNIIGTTAIAAENLSGIEVLNGLAGSLYGPQTPAGVFNYILKRPTDTPLYRFIEGFDSTGTFTEEADIGGRTADGKIGYRFDILHGEGGSYAPQSNVNRTLGSADLDFHIDDKTVIETDYSHYSTNSTGLPGSIVYDGASTNTGKNSLLPKAIDPTKLGLGQPGAGADLVTDTGLVKIKHQFNDEWNLELGGLYQNAVRNLWGITNTFNDNNGNFTTTKNFNAVPHFTIGSNEAALNGHFEVFGMMNDLTIGTNGFINGQFSYRNSIMTTLGNANINNLVVFPSKPIPNNGGQYESAVLTNQTIITGDTIHFTDQLALQGVLSTSWISSKSYSAADKLTSQDHRDGVLSPTVSVIYKPIPRLTTYATFSDSVEQGDQAPAGTANANQVLPPYQDHMYEVGVKYAVYDNLLVTLDGFRMTRPLAITNAANLFEVVGTQRNYGVEFFAQGEVTPEISVLGGVTYIDARLLGTHSATTDGKLVVGVPEAKGDIAVDYHPAFANGFAMTGAVHFESERAATNTNNSFAPAYATLDLGARYSTTYFHHAATARFEVINVTDTHYYSSIADGNIVGSPGANTAYFGTPRTFLANLEVDF